MRRNVIQMNADKYLNMSFTIEDCHGWLYVKMSSPLWAAFWQFFLAFDLTAFSPSQDGRLVHFRLYDISLSDFYKLFKEYYE